MPALEQRRFTMDTVEEAYRSVMDGTVRGKAVVNIGEAAGTRDTARRARCKCQRARATRNRSSILTWPAP